MRHLRGPCVLPAAAAHGVGQVPGARGGVGALAAAATVAAMPCKGPTSLRPLSCCCCCPCRCSRWKEGVGEEGPCFSLQEGGLKAKRTPPSARRSAPQARSTTSPSSPSKGGSLEAASGAWCMVCIMYCVAAQCGWSGVLPVHVHASPPALSCISPSACVGAAPCCWQGSLLKSPHAQAQPASFSRNWIWMLHPCMHACTHVHIHMHMHTHTHAHAHAHAHTHTHTYTYTHTHTHVQLHAYTHTGLVRWSATRCSRMGRPTCCTTACTRAQTTASWMCAGSAARWWVPRAAVGGSTGQWGQSAGARREERHPRLTAAPA